MKPMKPWNAVIYIRISKGTKEEDPDNTLGVQLSIIMVSVKFPHTLPESRGNEKMQ